MSIPINWREGPIRMNPSLTVTRDGRVLMGRRRIDSGQLTVETKIKLGLVIPVEMPGTRVNIQEDSEIKR